MSEDLLNELRRIRVLKLEAEDRREWEVAGLYRDEEIRLARQFADRALLEGAKS